MRNSTTYGLAGTKTFRRSSRKILGKVGGNLQNIKKEMRSVYIPDGFDDNKKAKCKYWLETFDNSVFTEQELFELRIFVQTDQSGAEALCVAYDSEPGDYRQLFIHNVKPHVYVALKLFKEIWPTKAREHSLAITEQIIGELDNTIISQLKLNPYWKELDKLIKDSDNWPLTERFYYLAKQTVHSANYDIQWATFIMNVLEKSGGKIVLLREQGEHFLEFYRALFPEIPERNERVKQQVEKYKIIYNMFGFPYEIHNAYITESKFKEYYAWGMQSTVAEITRIAYSRMQEYIERWNKKWDILADTHDSYLIQCPLEQVKDCAQNSQDFMNQTLTSTIDRIPFQMRSETSIGFNWGPYKKVTNELGLRELRVA